MLPRFITHTYLILLPKKRMLKYFQLINLDNFINKIISRLVFNWSIQIRIVKSSWENFKGCSMIISPNQTDFVKGRSITKNILLAQEIIRDIILRSKWRNVVIKLDMKKVCERVSWLFLSKVWRKFDFRERIIDIIWRLLSNNWYSVLISGQSYEFFPSSRGLKQGGSLFLQNINHNMKLHVQTLISSHEFISRNKITYPNTY